MVAVYRAASVPSARTTPALMTACAGARSVNAEPLLRRPAWLPTTVLAKETVAPMQTAEQVARALLPSDRAVATAVWLPTTVTPVVIPVSMMQSVPPTVDSLVTVPTIQRRESGSAAVPCARASDAARLALGGLSVSQQWLYAARRSAAPRPGAPDPFTADQVVEIINLACTPPRQAGYPLDVWTPRELADAAKQIGIVSSISPTSVGRFLKRGQSEAASQPLLAERQDQSG